MPSRKSKEPQECQDGAADDNDDDDFYALSSRGQNPKSGQEKKNMLQHGELRKTNKKLLFKY